jgi:aryl-alcohol dehydrogenase-like predicted oxidoreductase
MDMRAFGRTGMRLSVLGFRCGAVGGLMVRGDPADRERTIASAIAAGVNYFDTAVQHANDVTSKPPPESSRYKVRLSSSEFGRIADAVATSLESSLARLSRECLDIFHLRNAITDAGGGDMLSGRQSCRRLTGCGNSSG